MFKVYKGEPKKDDIEMRKVYSSKLSELMKKDENNLRTRE